MTDSTGASTPAGWYRDPAGSNHLRWWDGTVWTAHLAPQPTPTPVVQTPVVEQPYVPFQGSWNTGAPGQTTAVAGEFARPMGWNTTGVWLLAFSGLLSAAGLIIALLISGATISSPYGSGVILGSSFVVFLISVLFAEADRRKLRSLGYLTISSLWWMLLAPPLVYLILRTVRVWGETRRGIAPLITYFVVSVVGGVAASATIALLLPGLAGLSSGLEFASSLQTGLDQNGGRFTVTCPAVLPTVVGSTFSCTAVDSSHVSHLVKIQVMTGADGKPDVKLISVTPPISG